MSIVQFVFLRIASYSNIETMREGCYLRSLATWHSLLIDVRTLYAKYVRRRKADIHVTGYKSVKNILVYKNRK